MGHKSELLCEVLLRLLKDEPVLDNHRRQQLFPVW